MHGGNIGIVDLRRKLSAWLETSHEQPLMVHRYGSPWVCVVSDAHWQQHASLLDFDPNAHPLGLLLKLQRQWLRLDEAGALPPAAIARALLLQSMHGLPGLLQLHDHVRHHRLWHWFVAGGHGPMEAWLPARIQACLQVMFDEGSALPALAAFASRSDVDVLARRCGGYSPRIDMKACREMLGL